MTDKLFLSAIIVLCAMRCDQGVEPPAPAKVDLTLESATTTEAWLKLAFPDSPNGRDFTLARDGNTIAQGRFTCPDTTIIDDSLVAGRTYTYVGNKLENGLVVGSSSPLQVRTMDSTSHNFTWQTFRLGDGNSSVLYDVAIINDTLVYAVGEIYLRDSTGQFNEPGYNLACWNGKDWNLIRVLVRDFGGSSWYFPLKAVYGFAANDVWMASDADLIQWNGSSYVPKAFFMTAIPFDGQVLRMWGTSGSDLYCVGRAGAVYHYMGATWQKIESGTSL